MRRPQRCMMGATALLLLCKIAVSQLCKSLITMVDGFHTLFILMQMALPQTQRIMKPCISSLDYSPSSPHASSSTSSLGTFPHPLHPDLSAVLPPGAQSDNEHPNHNPDSPINSKKLFSPAAPSCTLSFPNSRIQPVGVLISSLLLVSLCVSYFLEIVGFVVKPHPVQHPLLPVMVGVGSLLLKMLLFALDWDELLGEKPDVCREVEAKPHLEINYKVCAAEESRCQEEEELSVPSRVQTAEHGCLHSGALVLCSPGTPGLPDPGCKTDLQLLETGEGESDVENKPEPSSLSKSSSGLSCRWSLWLPSFVFVIQGLFTPLLALINSLVTLLVVPQFLHSSAACTILVYLDPGLSLLAVITLIATSLPKVNRYGMLLLQASPPSLRVSDVRQRIAAVPGVKALHELHIWQLTESLTVASVHVHCNTDFPLNRCADLMSGVSKVLQNVGVSCCTVQPEFTSSSSSVRGDEASTLIDREDRCSLRLPPCSLACGRTCAASMCCSLLEKERTRRPQAAEQNDEAQTVVIENTFL